MSICSDDPEYFDEWIERRAVDGWFGAEIKAKVENGDLPGYELWPMLDKLGFDIGQLGGEASANYCERFIQ